MEGRKKLERRVGVGEWEWGGYGRVEHVGRVENAESRQIRLRVVPADSADFLARLRVLHECAIMLAVGKQTMRFVYEFSNNSIPRQA